MSKLSFSPVARKDLFEIIEHIAEHDPAAAEKLFDEIVRAARILDDFPEAGALRLDIAPDIRYLPVRKYVIFYRIAPDAVEVIRVLHGSRDYASLLD